MYCMRKAHHACGFIIKIVWVIDLFSNNLIAVALAIYFFLLPSWCLGTAIVSFVCPAFFSLKSFRFHLTWRKSILVLIFLFCSLIYLFFMLWWFRLWHGIYGKSKTFSKTLRYEYQSRQRFPLLDYKKIYSNEKYGDIIINRNVTESAHSNCCFFHFY